MTISAAAGLELIVRLTLFFSVVLPILCMLAAGGRSRSRRRKTLRCSDC